MSEGVCAVLNDRAWVLASDGSGSGSGSGLA